MAELNTPFISLLCILALTLIASVISGYYYLKARRLFNNFNKERLKFKAERLQLIEEKEIIKEGLKALSLLDNELVKIEEDALKLHVRLSDIKTEVVDHHKEGLFVYHFSDN